MLPPYLRSIVRRTNTWIRPYDKQLIWRAIVRLTVRIRNQDNMAIETERLRQARERLGLTQRQLAHLSGLGEQQIHRYESGKSDASSDGLKAIAQQLHVTTDYLLGLSDDPRGYGELPLREDERKLLEAYSLGDSVTMLKLLAARWEALAKQRGEKAEE